MRHRWLAFAATGDPNGPLPESAVPARVKPRPAWPPYSPDANDGTASTRMTLIIDVQDRLESDPRSARRRAWQEFVPHV
jgi:carboxylesterase type B